MKGANRLLENKHDDHRLQPNAGVIDQFTKYADVAPCMTASAEETFDHLINVWIARHGCPTTFQSDSGKAFVGDLIKKSMKRSQVA